MLHRIDERAASEAPGAPRPGPLPPALARRIDRLARRAHAFHRWAHHPLCDGYAADVIPLGRRARVCRGCAFAAAGAAVGLALGLYAPAVNGAVSLAAAALLLGLVPAAIPALAPAAPAPPSPPKPRRTPKLLSRFAPTALAGGAVGQALAAPSPARAAAAALAAAAVAWAVVRYRRRGPDRSACGACPAAPPGPRCPGFAPMVRRERAFSRLAARWMTPSAAMHPGAAAGRSRSPPPEA